MFFLKSNKRKINSEKSEHEIKIEKYYHLLSAWLELKEEHKSLASFFLDNNYNKIAIYGMAEMGRLLEMELKGSGIEVKCFIDRTKNDNSAHLPVKSPDDELLGIDVVVVTASYYFQEIKEYMMKKTNADIVSIDDIIYYLQ